MADVKVGIIMGSQSDWPTMQRSGRRSSTSSASPTRRGSSRPTAPPTGCGTTARPPRTAGSAVIIAGAGGAAHLPGMMASKTRVPVIGVPVQTKALSGVDSLYSIVQMPKGFPGRHDGDRRRRGGQCRADGGGDPRAVGRRASPSGSTPGAPRSRPRSPMRRRMSLPMTEPLPRPARTRRHDRHPRRRPARPDALGRRLAAGAEDPYLRARRRSRRRARSPTGSPPPAYDDEAALRAFGPSVDVITYEFENIPTAALDILEACAPVRPDREALRISQDRLVEKEFIAELRARRRRRMRRSSTCST